MSGPIKVMHVITGLDVGGAEGMLHALATASGASELRQSVVSLVSGGRYAELLGAAGVPVHSLGMRRGVPSPGGIVALARRIAGERPDIVQGWMYHGDLAATVGLWLSGRRRRTRLAWGLRCSLLPGADYGPSLQITRKLWVWLSGCADLLIANSDAGLKAHEALGAHPRAHRVIANGIDTKRFRPDPQARAGVRHDLGIPEDSRVIAHVARVDRMKDHATLLAAMRRLPQARAILIGRGTEGLPDRPRNAIALGQRDDVPALLAAADLTVSSSAYGEGFCNALAEGMATGLPAVATDVGDARMILGDTGFVCPPRQPAALAAAIETLLGESEDRFRRRGEAARQRVVENFSLDRAAADFTRAYRELIDR